VHEQWHIAGCAGGQSDVAESPASSAEDRASGAAGVRPDLIRNKAGRVRIAETDSVNVKAFGFVMVTVIVVVAVPPTATLEGLNDFDIVRGNAWARSGGAPARTRIARNARRRNTEVIAPSSVDGEV
jgi:hypothetical protein